MAVTRDDVRRALAASGGDLRAVGEKFGLATREVLMVLAYGVTITATNAKTEQLALGVFDGLGDKPD